MGIIARVCTYLSAQRINILDISQTITGGYFNMMMVVDVTDSENKIDAVSEELQKLGEELGVVIRLQLSEIFTMMHRI